MNSRHAKRPQPSRSTRGRPRKLVDPRIFPLRLPSQLKRELQHFALDEGRSLNDILVGWIVERWKGGSR